MGQDGAGPGVCISFGLCTRSTPGTSLVLQEKALLSLYSQLKWEVSPGSQLVKDVQEDSGVSLTKNHTELQRRCKPVSLITKGIAAQGIFC